MADRASELSVAIALLERQVVDRAIARYWEARPTAGPDPLIEGLIDLRERERKAGSR